MHSVYVHIHWYTQMRSHMTLYILVHTHNSYLPVIEVHEMHCRMNPNYYQIIILFVVDLCSSLAYFTMTQPLPIASKLPIKTLVARQLPTNNITYIYTSYTHIHGMVHDFLNMLLYVHVWIGLIWLRNYIRET